MIIGMACPDGYDISGHMTDPDVMHEMTAVRDSGEMGEQMGLMQTGVRLHDVQGDTIEDKVRTAHDMGFKCAQVALTRLIPDYPEDDGILTPGYAMYLKRLFASYDMDIAVLGCYLNLATPDGSELEHTLSRYRAHIRFASYLGCGAVGTESGAPNTSYTYEAACRGEEAYEVLRKNLGTVMEYAGSMGVIVALEPVASHIIYDAKRARRLLDEIGSPNLRVILDPVNLIDLPAELQKCDRRASSSAGQSSGVMCAESVASDLRELMRQAFELLGPEIDFIHLKDYRVGEDSVIPCVAGEGVMDYSELAGFIKRKPYIHCLLENTTPLNAADALRFAEKL